MSIPQGVPPAVTRWQPAALAPDAERPPMLTSIGRGLRNRCPACGEGKVFAGYLAVVPECAACGAPLGRLRADDAPPYIVIFLTGHLLLPPVFWVETAYQPPMWLHMVVWLPLFAAVCTLLLRPVKGAVVGWMWRLGFGDADSPHDRPAATPPANPGLHGDG